MQASTVTRISPPKRILLKEIRKHGILYVFLLPAIVLVAIFCYEPMIGIIIAFQDYKVSLGYLGSPFVGLQHFIDFLKVPDFYRALKNTVVISVLNIIIGFPLPVIFALMLNELYFNKFRRVVQTITYLPHFISWVVIGGLAYRMLAVDGGPVNQLIVSLGGKQVPFFREERWFLPIYMFLTIWKELGWNSIIYLAALQSIDPQLYEAAIIDGASRFRCIVHISIPGILTTISLLFILTIGTLVSGASLDAIFNLKNPLVMNKAMIIDLYTYMQGIGYGKLSYAAAMGLSQSVISFLLVLLANAISRRISGYGVF